MLLCVFCCEAISFSPLTSPGARASIFLVETILRQIIYRRMAFCAAMATCDNAISARRLRADDDGIGFFMYMGCRLRLSQCLLSPRNKMRFRKSVSPPTAQQRAAEYIRFTRQLPPRYTEKA